MNEPFPDPMMVTPGLSAARAKALAIIMAIATVCLVIEFWPATLVGLVAIWLNLYKIKNSD